MVLHSKNKKLDPYRDKKTVQMSYKIFCQKNTNLMSDYKINLPDYKNLMKIQISRKLFSRVT